MSKATRIDNDSLYLILEKDKVTAEWGSSPYIEENYNIDEYKDTEEEDDSSYISYGYLNDLLLDQAMTDSTTVASYAEEEEDDDDD